MQFLKTLFWVVLAVILVVFANNNWTPVTLNLWNDVVLETHLPVLVIGAFFAGLVPYFILHRTTKWSLNRKLTAAERNLAEVRGYSASTNALPPSAAPIAVPPGVS